jgi:hypothetical protein
VGWFDTKKLVFDDNGNPYEIYEMEDAEEFSKDGIELSMALGRNLRRVRERLMLLIKRPAKEKGTRKRDVFFCQIDFPYILYRSTTTASVTATQV